MCEKNPTFESEKASRDNSVNLHFNKGLPTKGNVSERSENLASVSFFSPKVGNPACNPNSAMKKPEKIVGTKVAPTRQPLPSEEILQILTNSENPNVMREHLRELWDNLMLKSNALDVDMKIDIYCTYRAVDDVLKALAVYQDTLNFKTKHYDKR